MKITDKVETPHGPGVIVDIEKHNKFNRYGVKLDVNPFTFPVAYYFEKDLKQEKN
ncbi:MAG: hypothetical protein WC998_04850 [Candidatus Paceibacterota bacterium]|jgi:hypothetical protein